MDQKDLIQKLQEQINQLIGVQSNLKTEKKTPESNQKDIFLSTFYLLEHVVDRGPMLYDDFSIDLSQYDESFFQIIDNLIYMSFGKEASNLIMFYLYDRINPDGTFNMLVDNNDNIVPMNKPEDLWDVIQKFKKK